MSAALIDSASSFLLLSSSEYCSASFLIFSISFSVRLVVAVILTLCSLPVPRSFALTCTMPLASMSKLTSIWGIPLGAGGIPTRSNWPNSLLSVAMLLSPWKTRIVTAIWLSLAVLKTWLFFVGIVVFLSMSLVKTPPRVSMPRLSGVTSKSKTSLTSPASMPAWIAAPRATASSGLTLFSPSLPVSCLTSSCTTGILVLPPTRITLSISFEVIFASLMARVVGIFNLSIICWISCSILAFVSSIFKCFGPCLSAVMKGRLIAVFILLESSILAFSAASFIL